MLCLHHLQPSANHFPFHPRRLDWGNDCREKLCKMQTVMMRQIFLQLDNSMYFLIYLSVSISKSWAKCRLLWWVTYFYRLTIVCTCWLYLFQKVVQNADCSDEADMQIGLKAQRGKMWGARWSGQRGLLTRAENFWPAHTSTNLVPLSVMTQAKSAKIKYCCAAHKS